MNPGTAAVPSGCARPIVLFVRSVHSRLEAAWAEGVATAAVAAASAASRAARVRGRAILGSGSLLDAPGAGSPTCHRQGRAISERLPDGKARRAVAYLMPTTMESGPTRCSARVSLKPASSIQPMQSAAV